MEYRGWKNFATFAVGSWIDNNETAHLSFVAMAGFLDNRVELADTIRSTIMVGAPDLGAGMYSDILEQTLEEVDWFELADHFKEIAQED
jgi:hypothetical protein